MNKLRAAVAKKELQIAAATTALTTCYILYIIALQMAAATTALTTCYNLYRIALQMAAATLLPPFLPLLQI